MKPFDLERALAGDPVVTRDGRNVEQLFWFDKSSNYQKVFAVVEGTVHRYYENGVFIKDLNCNHDLFMAPKVREYWVNVYRNKEGKLELGAEYESEEGAKLEKSQSSTHFLTHISTIKLTEEI